MDSYADARDEDLADYERAEAGGDLHTAAEWYRKAAENDFADAALRLATVLGTIAEQYLNRPGRRRAAPDELSFVSEASHWYIAAYMAGDINSDDFVGSLERLIIRRDTARGSASPPPLLPARPALRDSQ